MPGGDYMWSEDSDLKKRRYSRFEERFKCTANPYDTNTWSVVWAHFRQLARDYQRALKQLQAEVQTAIILLEPTTICEPVLMTVGHPTKMRETAAALEEIRIKFVDDWMLVMSVGYDEISVDIRRHLE